MYLYFSSCIQFILLPLLSINYNKYNKLATFVLVESQLMLNIQAIAYNLQFIRIVCNILSWFVDFVGEVSGVPWASRNGGWVLVVSELHETKFDQYSDPRGWSWKWITFLQSWKTAKPTEMTNEKKDNCKALNALIPKIPRPNGTSVITFKRMKVRIGTATFLSFDLRDSTGAVLNLTLKSTSSFCRLRDEMVTLLSATGKSNETSLRWM